MCLWQWWSGQLLFHVQRQMSAAVVASSVRLLYTTTGLCLERAARSQWWRPKNKTCVSALSLVILGYSWLSIVFLLVNTPPLLQQAFILVKPLHFSTGPAYASIPASADWDRNLSSGRLVGQAALSKPDCTPSSFCTAVFSHHFITPWHWMGPLHDGRVYDPSALRPGVQIQISIKGSLR